MIKIPRSVALLLAVMVSLFLVNPSSAQDEGRITNPRVGLVNAFESSQAAYETNAGWELVYFRWDELQPTSPSDWTPAGPTDDEWLGSTRSSGREVVGVLIGTPQWATEGNPNTGIPGGLYLPVNDATNLWAAFVRRTVGYYASRGVTRWVIWEDMDVPSNLGSSTWDGSTEDYYQLLKVAYLVAKEANPEAQIHVGGIGSYDPAWFGHFLDEVISDPTASSNEFYFDVATTHIFYSPESSYTQAANPFYLMSAKSIPLKPVWVNQTNARPAIDPAYPADTTFRNHRNVTQEQQAAYLIQSYALGFSAGAERIATYQLVDDLAGDESQAYGLIRADGSARSAYVAQQIIADEFNGFVFARRVDEETFPLIDYVRLTFASKVTHVVWARTADSATLIIPARSEQATLIDMYNNRWIVTPVGGEYRVVAGGADCNEPTGPSGCLIGGEPWILVEEGLADPLNEKPPTSRVEEGGETPTPDPGQVMTATAQAAPTATAIPPSAEETGNNQPTDADAGAVTNTPTLIPTDTPIPTPAEVASGEDSVEESAEDAPQVGVSPPSTGRAKRPGSPQGIAAMLPFLMIGIGVLSIIGGAAYFVIGQRNEDDYIDDDIEPLDENDDTEEEYDYSLEDE